MSATDLDEEFEQILGEIEAEKSNLNEDEQNLVDSWISKLREFDGDNLEIRNEYVKLLKWQLTRDDRHLSEPYLHEPPESGFPRLQELLDQLRPADTGPSKAGSSSPGFRRYLCLPPEKKPPCRRKPMFQKQQEKPKRNDKNDFEDPQEMARCIARSKGLMLPAFVADISRHTADKGFELRAAMKSEITSFNEYVERIMNQRIKDMGDRLDSEQNNELNKIQFDYDKWQLELSNCKKQIKEIVPDFDVEAYRKDPNYLKNVFSVASSSATAEEDKFKEWKEENCLRLMWFVNQISKLTEENNQVLEQISAIKLKTSELEKKEAQKQQRHANFISEQSAKYQHLKQKSHKLGREIADLLMKQKN